MAKAAIFIPSNRKLEQSIEPLWSAMNYAEARGMQVVISDNAREAVKREYFSNAPGHVTYLADGPEIGTENAMAALNATDADFVLMLGDDDKVETVADLPAFDFSGVPSDVIGVKPRIEIVNSDGTATGINEFTIDEADPATRIIEYTRKMGGANSTFYSFFRRDVFRSVLSAFTDHHPNRAGNIDFAIVYALIAEGRMLHDPSTVLTYNNSNWDGSAAAGRSMDGIFKAAGLPDNVRQYMMLFHFLDAYVLLQRKSSSLDAVDQYKSGYAVAMVFLKRLLFRIDADPLLYGDASDLVAPLRDVVESDDADLDRIFHVASLMADRVRPGLKQQYDRFLMTVARDA